MIQLKEFVRQILLLVILSGGATAKAWVRKIMCSAHLEYGGGSRSVCFDEYVYSEPLLGSVILRLVLLLATETGCDWRWMQAHLSSPR